MGAQELDLQHRILNQLGALLPETTAVVPVEKRERLELDHQTDVRPMAESKKNGLTIRDGVETEMTSFSPAAKEAQANFAAVRYLIGSYHWGSALKQMELRTQPTGNPETPMQEVDNIIADLTHLLLTDIIIDHPVSDIGATLPQTLTEEQYGTIRRVLRETLHLSEYHDKQADDAGKPGRLARTQRQDVETVLMALRSLYSHEKIVEVPKKQAETSEAQPEQAETVPLIIKDADFMGQTAHSETDAQEVRDAFRNLFALDAWEALLTSELVPPKMQKIIESRMSESEGHTISRSLQINDTQGNPLTEEEMAVNQKIFLEAAAHSLTRKFTLFNELLSQGGDLGRVVISTEAMLLNVQAHRNALEARVENGSSLIIQERLRALTVYEEKVTDLYKACSQALGQPYMTLSFDEEQALNEERLIPEQAQGSNVETPEPRRVQPRQNYLPQLIEAAYPAAFRKETVMVGQREPIPMTVFQTAEIARDLPRLDLPLQALHRLEGETVGQHAHLNTRGVPEIKKREAIERICKSLNLQYNPETDNAVLDEAIASHPLTLDNNIPVHAFVETALGLARSQGVINELNHLDYPHWAFLATSLLGEPLRKIEALPTQARRKCAELVGTKPAAARFADISVVEAAARSQYELAETTPDFVPQEGAYLTAYEATQQLLPLFTGNQSSLMFLADSLVRIRDHSRPSCGESAFDPKKTQDHVKPNIVILGASGTGKTANTEIVANALGVKVVAVSAASLTQTGIVGEHPDTILYKAVQEFARKYGEPLGLPNIISSQSTPQQVTSIIREMERGCLVVLDEAARVFPRPEEEGQIKTTSEAADPAGLLRELRPLLEPGSRSIEIAEMQSSGLRALRGSLNVENVCFALVASLTELKRLMPNRFDLRAGQRYGISRQPGIQVAEPEDLITLGMPEDIAGRFPLCSTNSDLTPDVYEQTWMSDKNTRNPRNILTREKIPQLIRDNQDHGTITITAEADRFIIKEAVAKGLNLGYRGLANKAESVLNFLRWLWETGLKLNGRELEINLQLAEAAFQYEDKKAVSALMQLAASQGVELTAGDFVELLSKQYRAKKGITR